MNFDVAVNGRPWKVAIEPGEQPSQFCVVVKGRRRMVDASWIDADTLSLIEGPAAREVRVHRRDAGVLGIEIGGTIFEALVSKRGRAPFSDLVGGKGARDPFSVVKAPMPGRIVRLLVAVGDRVIPRQPVVVVEAMKMENELRSPKEGTVKEVAVVPGAAVDAGAVLVVIE